MPDTETQNLPKDYQDENPTILSEKQLQDIAKLFNLPLEKIKKFAKDMTKSRANIDQSEIAPEQ